MKHIIICGEIGVGKSTLINKLLQDCRLPLYGFITKMMRERADGFQELYMFRAADRERRLGDDNFLAICNGRVRDVRRDVFEGMGAGYILEAKPGGIIVMDEIGFMEADAKGFCSAVLSAFDGDIPVIAAVKSTHSDIDFLNSVRNHPNAELHYIDKDNRNALYHELLPKVRELIEAAAAQGESQL